MRVDVCVCLVDNVPLFCLLVFHPARVSACSGVIRLIRVPGGKDEGVWLVIRPRPKCCHVRKLTLRHVSGGVSLSDGIGPLY